MEDDGIEEIRYKKENACPPGMHNFAPVIEGNQTTGLVCMACEKTVREDMEYSSLVATDKGLQETRQRPPSHKDPRF